MLLALSTLDVAFDRASINETETVLEMGVEPSRIIYAAPCKATSHLRFAAEQGIRKTVFDNEAGLYTIEDFHPEATIYLRIRAGDTSSGKRLADNFGASLDDVQCLLVLAKQLCLQVVGVTFRVGSFSKNPQAFVTAVQDARHVYDMALQEGFQLQSIDIGGGFTLEVPTT